jgi:hypothetical protein
MEHDDLTNRYNDGLVPAPQPVYEALRLRRPLWIPTPAQMEAARKNLLRNLLILALAGVAVFVIFSLNGGL